MAVPEMAQHFKEWSTSRYVQTSKSDGPSRDEVWQNVLGVVLCGDEDIGG